MIHELNINPFDKPDLNELAHYGVKGMRWGHRKQQYKAYQDRVHKASPGAIKTSVKTKTGEKISVVKAKPGPLGLAVSKLVGRKPHDNLSAMEIVDSSGKKVGQFQIWREGSNLETVRGEWLSIKDSSQGRGYSKAAIEGLIKSSKNDKFAKEIRLQVPSNAEAAKHIYSQLGFKKDVDLGDAALYGNIEDWVRKI
jgi:ribosomal protein S18 acetylase RimI-like enzyme